MYEGWANGLLAELNDPNLGKDLKYNQEEKNRLNTELNKLKDTFSRIESNIRIEDKFLVDNFNSLIELGFDFTNYVVDPLYNGNGRKAIQALMKRAVDEQKKKLSVN
jgi:hypothetical protein